MWLRRGPKVDGRPLRVIVWPSVHPLRQCDNPMKTMLCRQNGGAAATGLGDVIIIC